MARVVGSGLCLVAAGLLVLLVVLLGAEWPVTLGVAVAAACQVTALWVACRDPAGHSVRKSWTTLLLRLGVGFWCVATGSLTALSSMATIHYHGFMGLVIPGTAEAAFDEWGCCPSMKLPDLAVITLFVVGQLSGAVIVLGPRRRPAEAGRYAGTYFCGVYSSTNRPDPTRSDA